MNSVPIDLDPLRRLILAYALPADRERYRVAFAFDAKLAEIIRSTSELLIGQMRLTWWRDILTKDPSERPVGEPLLEMLRPIEIAGQNVDPLNLMIEGWGMLLEDFPWDDRQFEAYASQRGEGLFAFALGQDKFLAENQKLASHSWALWDFARHCSDRDMREKAFAICSANFSEWEGLEFDRSGRPLSIFCEMVARDVRKGQLSADVYTPSVAGRIIWHGLTGW